jgi:poly-gamma-glutamate capsule biosynthesis protein CapA/YwtB (metallophosphatase superfamily)
MCSSPYPAAKRGLADPLLSYSRAMTRAREQRGIYMKPNSGFASRGFVVATCMAAAFSSIDTPAWSQSSVIITLTGQSMIRSDLRATAPLAVPRIRALLQGDVIFTNLEGTVAESGQSVQEGRGFLTPPESLDALQALGFNLLSLSNNHAFDLKDTGIENTLREVNRRNIVHAGTGHTLAEAAAPGYLRTSNVTIALVSSASGLIAPGGGASADRPGVNELRIQAGDKPNEATVDLPGAPANKPNQEDAERILQSIRDAKQHSGLVIVYQHNHVFGIKAFSTLFNEGMAERLAPNEWLKKWAHAEIDAGADLVVMHGAPLLHGVEIFHGKPIFYDLGNFIFNVPPTIPYITEPLTWESVVANVEFQGHTLRSITFRPIELNNIGDGQPDVHNPYASNEFLHTRGLPSLATGAKAKYILERLAELSMPLGTTVILNGETAEINFR